MAKFSKSLSFSVFLHVAVGVVLTISMTLNKPTPPDFSQDVPIIDAVVIDQKMLETQINNVKNEQQAEREKEEQRVKELERRAEEAERQRQQQESEVAELKKQTDNQLKEKKKAEQAALEAREKQKREKAAALEEERKRKEQEKLKAEAQAKAAKEKREKEEKALKEAKRRKQEAAEKAAQEKLLQEQLQAEQAVRQQRRNKQVLSEVDKYLSLINQTIQNKWIVDDSMNGKSCRLNIRLASNGFVTKVTELGGDPVLCRAAKSAVYKAETLPISKEEDVNAKLRDINLTFNR